MGWPTRAMRENNGVSRAMSLRVQLLLLQGLIVLVIIVGTGIVASWLQETQLRDAYRDRMIAVAQSVAVATPGLVNRLVAVGPLQPDDDSVFR